MTRVWLVVNSAVYPPEVDSLWTSYVCATRRALYLGKGWNAAIWTVHEEADMIRPVLRQNILEKEAVVS